MARTSDVTGAALWGSVLILAIIVLAAGLWFLKRRFFSSAEKPEVEDFLSLQQLRKLQAEGQITQDEFERLKVSALDAARMMPTGKSSGRAEPARGDEPGPNRVK